LPRVFLRDSLIIKDAVRPGPVDHPGQDFLIPISMHSPSVMTVTAPVCPSRKTGTFCVCPLCVTSPCTLHAAAQYCHRITHQPSPARYHCLSMGNHIQNGKRMRTAFTSTQLLELEREFSTNMYLSRLRRIEIATVLEPVGEAGEDLVSEPRVKHKKEGKATQRSAHSSGCKCTSGLNGLLEVGGRGVSVSGLCVGGERGVSHLRANQTPLLPGTFLWASGSGAREKRRRRRNILHEI
uniref:GS homeobox 2 n=1 Tax=Cyclopterus lumpus TaxID=8103 RepID=A0A8C2ZJA8_CYCLU